MTAKNVVSLTALDITKTSMISAPILLWRVTAIQQGYYSLSEVFDTFRDTTYSPEIERRRNRGEITLSQNLGDTYGSISMGYVNEDYWNSDRKTQSATLGYNNSWQGSVMG